MKILILARYDELGASSRLRFYQFVPYLRKMGHEITIQYLLGKDYLNYLYSNSSIPLFQILKNYFKRFLLLSNKSKYDMVWLQHEAFPWLPSWVDKLLLSGKTPYVVDYDDAFFHRYDLNSNILVRSILGKKINKIMQFAKIVIVGNKYLANRAVESKAAEVIIVPTVVDLERYSIKNESEDNFFTIGWIGSPSNSKYLVEIQEALNEIKTEENIRIVLIGSDKISLNNISIEVKPWSEEKEVDEIKSFDVGIMPLIDSPWERGKCGYKLIQYMACGLPVIASPVGINSEIVREGSNGFLASKKEDWVKYLLILKNDSMLRKKMGLNGRKLVEDKYSLQLVASKIENVLQRAII